MEQRIINAAHYATTREEEIMTTRKVWLITGAGRGMGLDIAKAVLAAGHKVVATGRDIDKVGKAVGDLRICWS